MVVMEHPNGCVHKVRDDLVDRFTAAGWKIKGEETPPVVPTEQKKRRTKAKK